MGNTCMSQISPIRSANGIKIKDLLLYVFYAALILTGMVPNGILSAVLLIITVFLFQDRRFYLLFPAMLVYYSYFMVPIIQLSLFRVYSFLLILKLLLENVKIKKDARLAQLVPMLIYMTLAVLPSNVRFGIFGILDIVTIYLLVVKIRDDESLMRDFAGTFILACALSVATGFITNASMTLSYQYSAHWKETSRFLGTFTDPNYCCMFYIFSFYTSLIYQPFNKILRLMLEITVLVGVIATISFTGYFIFLALLIIYLFINKKISLKWVGLLLSVMLGCVVLYNYVINHPDMPVLGDVCYRIQSYLQDYESNADESISVGRLVIWKNKYSIYQMQSLWKQLFGFNTCTAYYNTTGQLLAHNDYMDIVYNYGFILALLFYVSVLYRTIRHMMLYIRYKNRSDAYVVFTKCLWLFYACALSMLAEAKFYLFLFI